MTSPRNLQVLASETTVAVPLVNHTAQVATHHPAAAQAAVKKAHSLHLDASSLLTAPLAGPLLCPESPPRWSKPLISAISPSQAQQAADDKLQASPPYAATTAQPATPSQDVTLEPVHISAQGATDCLGRAAAAGEPASTSHVPPLAAATALLQPVAEALLCPESPPRWSKPLISAVPLSQAQPPAGETQQASARHAVAAAQPATQSEDATLPAVSLQQHAQAMLCAMLLCLQSGGLHIHARIKAYQAIAAAACSAFGKRVTEARSICRASLLHYWAAARQHAASTALALQAWWSATSRTLVDTITRSLKVVLAAADFLTRTCKAMTHVYTGLCGATISSFSTISSVCTACMAYLFLVSSAALQISFGILADWRPDVGNHVICDPDDL
ncbi:hypothetical protein ABBQ38_008832 [Trebouxia sp. C0009 RCD-2024]